MLRIISYQHHRDVGYCRIRLDLANHLEAVGIVNIELAVHEHEIELAALKLSECFGGIIRLRDIAIEILG